MWFCFLSAIITICLTVVREGEAGTAAGAEAHAATFAEGPIVKDVCEMRIGGIATRDTDVTVA